ncbi:MAG TPA: DUF4998 domain-containing protein [Puia sp.]|nr:DUF4998 domain-containing protein [Puia sp.]
MKAFYKNSWIGLACFIAVCGCTRKANDYRSFLNGQEITYPGKIIGPNAYPGNLRLLLTWNPSPDPSVSKYVVYWNNYTDSTVVNAVSHSTTDTVKCLINNLAEYSYTFFIYSYDASGNRSILTELDNAKVVGPIYQAGLHNRPLDPAKQPGFNSDGSVNLYFQHPYDTINITTRIRYVNVSGDTLVTYLPPASDSIVLPSFKLGTNVLFQSSFIPKVGAIDTFYTLSADTAAPRKLVMCDKSLFSGMYFANDLKPYDGNTYLARLWDGNMQPRDYPNVFHSDGSTPLPGSVTFDMGKIYDHLNKVEETGRTQAHNPDDFEIWGIADTTGAIPAYNSYDAGWKADVTSKGWTLLKEVVRADDGINPFDATLIDNPPKVRFIIIRFLHTVDGSGYVNLSQVTFWDLE